MSRTRFRLVKILVLIVGFLLLALSTQSLMAQSQPVSGTVADSSGSVVPGAAVKITDLNQNEVVRQTTTDDSGRFSELDIEPGRYSVSIEKTGFKTSAIAFTVDVNREVALGTIKMDIGQITETISVNEVAPTVDTETMDKAYLVDQHEISQLPMNGRTWLALMSTVPGMSSSAQSDFGVNFNDVLQFHGLGGRGSENSDRYLDG